MKLKEEEQQLQKVEQKLKIKIEKQIRSVMNYEDSFWKKKFHVRIEWKANKKLPNSDAEKV